ncbi:hypothetical protein ABES02_28780 [Neobacillus pocheonensis]|uniref:hypothetical protein n=1 Tax=Neobacillus pocheonensis TaxID=363869 RepID=UPI003D2B3782
MLIDANAIRTDDFITVRLLGQLPTLCDEVVELGHYPANGTVSARIFLREGRKPGLENMHCIQGLGKIWSINRVIIDKYSNTVEIFINDYFVKKIRVIGLTTNALHNNH